MFLMEIVYVRSNYITPVTSQNQLKSEDPHVKGYKSFFNKIYGCWIADRFVNNKNNDLLN